MESKGRGFDYVHLLDFLSCAIGAFNGIKMPRQQVYFDKMDVIKQQMSKLRDFCKYRC